MKALYSTHDIARICHVAELTAIRWIDSGKIKGHRTPGGHRRVLHDDLQQFLKRQDMPTLKRNKTILIVEDESPTAELLAEVVSGHRRAYNPHIAEDGYSALAMIGKLNPDLIILDIGLPDINGYEILKRLRAGKLGCNPPVIVITGNLIALKESELLKEYADYSIEKPIGPISDFLEIVDNCLSNEKKSGLPRAL